jgi:hypothetical protein
MTDDRRDRADGSHDSSYPDQGDDEDDPAPLPTSARASHPSPQGAPRDLAWPLMAVGIVLGIFVG